MRHATLRLARGGADRRGRSRRPRRRFRVARVAVPLMIGIGGLVVVAVLLVFIATLIVSLALPAAVLATIVLIHRQRHGRRAARVGPSAAAVRTDPVLDWVGAATRFDALRGAYADHECDPMAVLRRPALSDVRVPSTSRFVDAFARAQALQTDAPPAAGHAAEFVAAVGRAERAWTAAVDAADRIRHSALSDRERAAVERTLKLLTTAQDSANDAERLAAYSLARSELAKLDRAGVVSLPRPARSALDAAARGELPG